MSAYETCPSCGGTGMQLDSFSGEPTHCIECGGNTVIRARDKQGRFTTLPDDTPADHIQEAH